MHRAHQHSRVSSSFVPSPTAALAVTVLLIFAASGAAALDPSSSDPKAIMTAALRTRGPARSQSRLKMTIHDHGGDRERVFSMRSKRYTDVSKTLTIIESPSDVRNTGFLSVSSDDSTHDEQWIYLPKLHRVSRVPRSGRADSFVGSDFTIADLSMSSQNADRFRLKLIDSAAKVGDESCWVIEATPRDADVMSEIGYERMQFWIGKTKQITLQFKASLPGGKKTKYLKVSDIRSVGGVWTPYRVQMRTVEGNAVLSETVIEYLSIDNDAAGVSDSDFTQQRLEQGA